MVEPSRAVSRSAAESIPFLASATRAMACRLAASGVSVPLTAERRATEPDLGSELGGLKWMS